MDVIRGAEELADWWRRVPIAWLRYRANALPDNAGLATLAGALRARAWRERCAAAGQPCVDGGRSCLGPERCRADRLYPVQLGGGSVQWRMATLLFRWLPSDDELHLVAIGPHAVQELGWAGRWLQGRHPLPLISADEADLAQLLPPGPARWRIRLVTPWLVDKQGGQARQARRGPDSANISVKLADSLAARAHKFTALALDGNPAQAVGSHLARYVCREVMANALRVIESQLAPTEWPLNLVSEGNRQGFIGIAWEGSFDVQADPQALPWLALLALCGLGENAEEGFGAVELAALP